MDAVKLLSQLEEQGIALSLNGDKIRLEGPEEVLTEQVVRAVRHLKPQLLVLLRERQQAVPKVLPNVFCFQCYRTYGKEARYQPHTVTMSREFNGWWELTCTRCGNKGYARPKGRKGGGTA